MILTIDEVATYLRVSRETIYKLAQSGQIPAAKVGTQWRFEQEAIEEWIRVGARRRHDNVIHPSAYNDQKSESTAKKK